MSPRLSRSGHVTGHPRARGGMGLGWFWDHAGRIIFATCLGLAPTCATADRGLEGRVRMALDVLAAVIDPAYELAVNGCAERERAEVAAERAGQPATETDQHLGTLRARCDRVRAAFETMRRTHEGAVAQVEAGAIDQAEASIEAVKAQWRALQAVTP